MRLSIIIPAYNEIKTIENVLTRLKAVPWNDTETEIIIVDDGSTDGTAALIDRYSEYHTIIHHLFNKGKGGAVQSGIAKATGEYVIIQDADLEYDPHDILQLIEVAKHDNLPIVYGSRLLPHPGIQQIRGRFPYYLGGRYLTLLTNFLYHTRITDEPTGYKMVKTELIKKLNLTSQGFGFCPELTAKIAKLQIPIHEVSISYHPRSVLEGKKIKLKDAFEATMILLRERFRK